MFRCHIENNVKRIYEVEFIVFIIFYITEKTLGKAEQCMHMLIHNMFKDNWLADGSFTSL